MLVLSRKVGEKIVVDDRVTITITRISGRRVSLGIVAPNGVRIVRGELEPHEAPQAAAPQVTAPQVTMTADFAPPAAQA